VSTVDLTLTDAIEDKAIVIVSEPESSAAEIVEFRSDGSDQSLLFGKTIDAGCSNHIQATVAGNPNGIAIVHEQTFGPEVVGERKRFAFSRVESSRAKYIRLRSIFEFVNVNPTPSCRYNLAGNWKLCARYDDFFEHRTRNRDPIEKHAKDIEIAERGKVHEWTTVGDDQTELPSRASSFEFFNGLAVRFPILGGIDNVRDAAWLEQFHKLEPAQTEFASRLARRNLTICKEGEDRFLAHSFLQFVLVDGAFGDVDFDFKLHKKALADHSTAVDKIEDAKASGFPKVQQISTRRR
jgi:hypothetical protein